MKRRVLAALLTTGLIAPASAFAVPDGGIELVDRPSGFGPMPFDGISEASVGRHAFSDNGCFLAITSNNDVLSALDDDDGADVFRIDRCSPGHPAALVSTTPAGVAADGDSFGATISADGTKVAFVTRARNLLPPGATVEQAVVVKDMVTGDVTVASRGADPAATIAEADRGVISGDGSAVAFRGRGAIQASNATGVAGEQDVYVRYLVAGDTRMASVIPPATRGGADGDFDIDYDGKAVALITSAPLDPTDADDDSAYLARNLLGTVDTHKVSTTQEPRGVAISGDGKQVAFTDARVWLADCSTTCGAPVAVDSATPPTGDVQTRGAGFPTAAGAPKLLFWTTDRSLLPADADTEDDAYVYDLVAAQVFRFVPHHAGGVTAGDVDPGDAAAFMAVDPALPGTNGGVAAQVFTYDDGGNTILQSLPDGETRRGQTDHTSIAPLHAVSESGRFVVMATDSPGLGAVSPAPGRPFAGQVIVRDVARGITTDASLGADGRPSDLYAGQPTVDALGDRVAFESAATNLVPGPTLGTLHVYVRDLATGALQRVDRKADGSPPAGGGHDAALAGDGAKVAFISDSPDLPDANGKEHAYLADLATGGIVLVDRTADGLVGDDDVVEVDVSADGSRVAFISYAMNLGGFATAQRRVFVKDVASGALTFASPPESGTPTLNAGTLSLSGDASRVAWSENDAGFGYGSDGRPHTFVRDLATGMTTLASVGGPSGANAYEVEGGLDRAGTHLVFLRRFDGGGAVLVRDLATGTTTDLLPGRRRSPFDVSVSPDGHCVAIGSNSPDVLATGNPGPDFDHVYLLGAGAACPPVPPAGGAGNLDRTPPAITRLRMLRKRFAVAARRTALTARRAKRGSAFLFTLSEDARTSIAIARALPGRRSGTRCVKPRKGLKRRCRRYAVVATLTRTRTKRGANRIAFTGRLGTRRLKPGRYRATVGAVDAAGNRATRKRVTFRVVRR